MSLINAALAVRQFSTTILGLEIPLTPSMLMRDRAQARCDHMVEELDEIMSSETIEDQADGFIDLLYLAIGGLVEMGLGDKVEKLFEEVHRANMSKARGVVSKRGNLHDAIKPEGWRPPDLKAIIWDHVAVNKPAQESLFKTGLVVTKDGEPLEDQVKGLRAFKEAALAKSDLKAKASPEETVRSRGEIYGTFQGRAVVCDEVMETLRSHPNWSRKLAPIHRHGLTMLVEKIGRIIEGNPNYLDNWHDVGGYGHLVETELKQSGKGF